MAKEIIRINTTDGWQLPLYHYNVQNSHRRFPVLLVHGLAANHLHLDLNEHYSLARTIHALGFQVYIIELRGTKESIPPPGNPNNVEWSFSEHLFYDIPAAIQSIQQRNKKNRLHGIGHSMGGMLLYALAVQPKCAFHSIATIGTPMISNLKLRTRELRLLKFAARLAPVNSIRRVPLRQLFGTAGRFIKFSSKLVDDILLDTANCEQEVIALMARNGINDVPLQMIVELTSQLSNLNKPQKPFVFEQNYDRIRTPILAISGHVDRVAPPESVLAAVQQMHTPDLRYREMGINYGDNANYGHIDLLVGRYAREEVYPLITDFLEEKDMSE